METSNQLGDQPQLGEAALLVVFVLVGGRGLVGGGERFGGVDTSRR